MSRARVRITAAITTLAAALTVTGTAQPATADPVITPLNATLACDPSGPTEADGDLADALNQTLTGTMDGYMSAYRVSCARIITKTVRDRGLPQRAATIAITTAIVESTLRNIDYGDRDSVGLFQQRSFWGSTENRLNPVWSTNAFLNSMESKYPNGSWQNVAIGTVCQEVQGSAYPARYAEEAGDGQKIAQAVWAYAQNQPAAARGTLWDRTRSAAGSWSGATKIDANEDLTAAAAAATPNGVLNVFTVLPDSGVWHKTRGTGGSWSGSTKIDENGKVRSVAAAALPDGTLHVITVVPGSGLWHRVRSASGSWAGSAKIDANGNITQVALAALPNGTLNAVALVPGSGLWARTRSAAGTWATSATQIDENESITAVAAAGLPNGTLHVAAVVPKSGVWHRVRSAAGAWAGSVKVDQNGEIDAVSLAGLADNTLIADTTVRGAGVWSRVRSSAGTWQGSATQIDQNGKVFDTYAAALPDRTVHAGALVDAR
jgi:hypothetical protein